MAPQVFSSSEDFAYRRLTKFYMMYGPEALVSSITLRSIITDTQPPITMTPQFLLFLLYFLVPSAGPDWIPACPSAPLTAAISNTPTAVAVVCAAIAFLALSQDPGLPAPRNETLASPEPAVAFQLLSRGRDYMVCSTSLRK